MSRRMMMAAGAGGGGGGGDFPLPTHFVETSYPVSILYQDQPSRLPDGRVVVVGGSPSFSGVNSPAVVLYSANSTSVVSTNYPTGITFPALPVLADGRILGVAGQTEGDIGGGTFTNKCYLGTVTGNTISWVLATGNYPLSAAWQMGFGTLPDGRVYVGGGLDNSNFYRNTYFGTVSGNTVTWAAGTLLPNSSVDTSTVMADGRIFAKESAGPAHIGTVLGNTISWAVAGGGSGLSGGTVCPFGSGIALYSDNAVANGPTLLQKWSAGVWSAPIQVTPAGGLFTGRVAPIGSYGGLYTSHLFTGAAPFLVRIGSQ